MHKIERKKEEALNCDPRVLCVYYLYIARVRADEKKINKINSKNEKIARDADWNYQDRTLSTRVRSKLNDDICFRFECVEPLKRLSINNRMTLSWHHRLENYMCGLGDWLPLRLTASWLLFGVAVKQYARSLVHSRSIGIYTWRFRGARQIERERKWI